MSMNSLTSYLVRDAESNPMMQNVKNLYQEGVRRQNSCGVDRMVSASAYITEKGQEIPIIECFDGYGMRSDSLIEYMANRDGIFIKYNTPQILEKRKRMNILSPEERSVLSMCEIMSEKDGTLPHELQRRVNSARQNAASPVSDAGYDYKISTMGYVLAGITQTLYPQDNIYDKFERHEEGGWATSLSVNVIKANFPSDLAVLAHQGSNNQEIKNVSADVSHQTFTVSTYVFQTVTNFIAQQEAAFIKMDLQGETLKQNLSAFASSLNKAYTIGTDNKQMNGYTTDNDVKVDTAIFNGKYAKEMDPSELRTVLTGFVTEGYSNSDMTLLPDSFIMSTMDTIGQGGYVSSNFPTDLTTGKAIEEALKYSTVSSGGPSGSVKIMASPFVDKSLNGLKTTYLLYNRSKENVVLLEPIPLTINGAMSFNGWNTSQICYIRSGGVAFKRPTSATAFFVK